MKNLKYFLMALPLAFLWSCSAEDGTEPGTASNPVVTMYSYAPEATSGMNADNDLIVRFATNNAVTELYYLIEAADAANDYIDKNGSDAYMQKVVEEGIKLDVTGAANIDENILDQHGAIIITGVACNGSNRSMAQVSFTGLDWNKICSGQFSARNIINGAKICDLEVCTTDKNLYRIKDAFKDGYSLKFSKMGLKGTDDTGMAFYPVRIPEAQTGIEVNLNDGSKSPLWVKDVAYWQQNADLATSQNYWSLIWEDNFCEFNLAWMTNKGCIAYGSASDGEGNTSYFIPDEVDL